MSLCLADSTSTMNIEGQYLGTNLIVKNPMKHESYSVTEVRINGKTLSYPLQSSAFEIYFEKADIEIGDSVQIQIFYNWKIGEPVIYNIEVLKPVKHFQFTSISCDRRRMLLQWTVDTDTLTGPFEVEQYRWNKWVTVYMVETDSLSKDSVFSVLFQPHSGRNLFRVMYVDEEGNMTYSGEVRYTSRSKEITLVSNRVRTLIEFSGETLYQLYTEFGGFLLDGWGNSIDVSGLENGKYFVNFDNKTEEIIKR
jgi:hypothetical protein